MTSQKLALISPRDGFAGWLHDTDATVAIVHPPEAAGRSMHGGSFRSRFPDARPIEAADEASLLHSLEQEQERCDTLDFTLALLNSDISPDTRSRAAAELELLLDESSNAEYVLDVLLARPLPDGTNKQLLSEPARPYRRVQSLLRDVFESQPQVKRLEAAWLAMRTNPLVREAGIDHVYGILLAAGVFRRFALEAKTQDDAKRLQGRLVFEPRLKDRLAPKIFVAFSAEYLKQLPNVVSQELHAEDDRVATLELSETEMREETLHHLSSRSIDNKQSTTHSSKSAHPKSQSAETIQRVGRKSNRVARNSKQAVTKRRVMPGGDAVSVEQLLKAKELAKELGGLAEAKAALEALSKIAD